jgi:hypothetical protein
MARILVYTPTYDDMLRPETVASVKAQGFNGEFVHEIDDRSLHAGRSMKEVCEKYRDARQMALDDGYDALMCVEHDMVLPPDCIQKLWNTNVEVAYAAYMLRHGTQVVNLFRYEGVKALGMSLSLYPKQLKRAKRQEVIRVSGGGFGATLIRREALLRCPFRVFDDNPPDMAFAGDCVRAGVRQAGRFDVACLHIDERGDVLSIEDNAVCRVEALQNVTVLDIDRSVEMKRGRYYTLRRVAAAEHARAGYVRITEDIGDLERETAEMADYEKTEPPKVQKRKPRARKTKTMSTKSLQ